MLDALKGRHCHMGGCNVVANTVEQGGRHRLSRNKVDVNEKGRCVHKTQGMNTGYKLSGIERPSKDADLDDARARAGQWSVISVNSEASVITDH